MGKKKASGKKTADGEITSAPEEGQTVEQLLSGMKRNDDGTYDATQVRDRITEFKKVRGADIMSHPHNWRSHPAQEIAAFKGILTGIGEAGVVMCYHSERHDGKLTAIDGHMRKDQFDKEWHCAITDLNDEEADKLIQAYDAVGLMARHNMDQVAELRNNAPWENPSVEIMLDGIRSWQPGKTIEVNEEGEVVVGGPNKPQKIADPNDETIPEMELQPYEHYDHLLCLFESSFDWNWICSRLGIQKVDGSTDPRYTKIGLGRAIPGSKLIEILKRADDLIAKYGPLEEEEDEEEMADLEERETETA